MKRSPVLAGVLSVVFPGLGHLYAGATARGLTLAAAFVALLHDELVPFVLAVWVLGIVNAIGTAEDIGRARAEGRPAAVSLDRNWAAGLIAAGGFATLARFPELEWALRLWPLLLVWIGFRLYRGQPVIPGGPGRAASGPATTSVSPPPPPAPPREGALGGRGPGEEYPEPAAGKEK